MSVREIDDEVEILLNSGRATKVMNVVASHSRLYI